MKKSIEVSKLILIGFIMLYSVTVYKMGGQHTRASQINKAKRRAHAQSVCYKLRQKELRAMTTSKRLYNKLRDYINN